MPRSWQFGKAALWKQFGQLPHGLGRTDIAVVVHACPSQADQPLYAPGILKSIGQPQVRQFTHDSLRLPTATTHSAWVRQNTMPFGQ